jgi:hypothetical protein
MTVRLGALHEGWTAFEADEGRRARAESSTSAWRSTTG